MTPSGSHRSSKAGAPSTRLDDRGEATTTLIIFLTVVTMFFLAVHAAFLYHGNNVVSSAAQEALFAAQLEGSDQEYAEAQGDRILALFAALTAEDVVVTFDPDTLEFTAVATATVTTPFLDVGTNLRSEVTGPAERFYEQYLREAGG